MGLDVWTCVLLISLLQVILGFFGILLPLIYLIEFVYTKINKKYFCGWSDCPVWIVCVVAFLVYAGIQLFSPAPHYFLWYQSVLYALTH